MFHNDAPMLNYCQKWLNSYCFSILASSLDIIEQNKAFNDISLRTEESLKIKMGNRIDFENAIMKNENKLKVTQECIIASEYLKKMGSYDILTYISEHVDLLQLMYYLNNVNHAISVVRY